MSNEIVRPNTRLFMGETLYVGMEIEVFRNTLSRALQNHPKLYAVLGVPFEAVEVVYKMLQPIMIAYNTIRDVQEAVKIAKRILETAVKVYNVGVSVQVGLLATFPVAGNGVPMGFPGGAVLTPLSTAIDTATTVLQETEDQLTELSTQLVETTNKFRKETERVQTLVMNTIIEAGNFRIKLEDLPEK